MSREFLEEFISIYESETCLWQVKSKHYHDRVKKDAGYLRLIEKLKTFEPNATKDAVIKKINNMRSAYRKEVKKIKASMKSGAGGDDIYEPKLWYFKLVRFLDDPDTPRPSCSNLDSSDDDTIHTQMEAADGTSQEPIRESVTSLEIEEREHDFAEHSGASSSMSSTNRPTPRRKITNKKRILEMDTISITNDVLESVKSHFKRPEDRFDVVGKTVAMKLRGLPKEQLLIAEKIINDALFQAEMGKLTELHELNKRAPSHFTDSQFQPHPLIQYQPSPQSASTIHYQPSSERANNIIHYQPSHQSASSHSIITLQPPVEFQQQSPLNDSLVQTESAATFVKNFLKNNN